MNIQKLRDSLHNAARVSYSRSGGPGGQNVNKVNTKVTLRLRLDALEGLTEAEARHLKIKLLSRLSSDGEELAIQSDEERLQSANERAAFIRLENLITASAKLPKKRRPTKPTKASKEKRLQAKKLRGKKKAARISAADGLE